MGLYNLARMTSATTGTGTLTLGSAVSGCLSFADAGVPTGAKVSYGISDGANSEVGWGTYTSSGTTLSRDTVLASTNSGNKINCSGSQQVFITVLSGDIAQADGWIPVRQTWAYASATTITVPSGAASIYEVGDKIKLTQTTVKYFVIVGVADTVLTVTGGSDYTVADAAITLPYYSKVANPDGFPSYFNYTPTFTGFSTDPSGGSYRFTTVGRMCFVTTTDTVIAGTSNATSLQVSIPISNTSFTDGGSGSVTIFSASDNSNYLTSNVVGWIYGSAISFFTDYNWGVWTASGTKRVRFSAVYAF